MDLILKWDNLTGLNHFIAETSKWIGLLYQSFYIDCISVKLNYILFLIEAVKFGLSNVSFFMDFPNSFEDSNIFLVGLSKMLVSLLSTYNV